MSTLDPPPGAAPLSPPASDHPPKATGAASLGGSLVAFLLCVVAGALPALAAFLLLRSRIFGPDRLAFYTLAVFAVGHVAALIVVVPRLQNRRLASMRYTTLIAILVWLLVVLGTIIGVRVWRSRAAEADRARKLEEGLAIDRGLAAGGFRRVVLDSYVALHDLDLVDGRYYVVGGTQTVWLLRSDDGGATWASRSLDPRFHSPRVIHFATPERGYMLASTEAGPVVLRTEDGGASFSDTPVPAVGWSMACVAPERCWVAGIEASTGRLHVHMTADGGRTWIGEYVLDAPPAPLHFSEPLCEPLPGPGDRVLCLSSRLDKTGSRGGFALLRSAAGDIASWTELPAGPDTERWQEIRIGSDRSIVAAASTLTAGVPGPVNGGLFARSADGSGDFTIETMGLPPGIAPMDVELVGDTSLYAISGDSLLMSADRGKTWIAEPSIAEYAKHGNLFLRKLEFTTPERGVIIKANGALLVRSGFAGESAGTTGSTTAAPEAH